MCVCVCVCVCVHVETIPQYRWVPTLLLHWSCCSLLQTTTPIASPDPGGPMENYDVRG